MFKIEIETCAPCGGAVKVLASIEDPVVIKQILDHLERRVVQLSLAMGHGPLARAPPPGALPGLGTVSLVPMVKPANSSPKKTRMTVPMRALAS